MHAETKRRLFRIAAGLLAAVLSLALLEALASIAALLQFRTLNVAALNAADLGEVVATPDRLQPHPFLAFVLSKKVSDRNNVGTAGHAFPLVKDPSKFTILLVGGSVADALARNGHLERALKAIDFGKPVVVLDGACPAWHQPQQTIMLAHYGELADAVISLDGFNESLRLTGSRERLEFPNSDFVTLNPLLTMGHEKLGKTWECQRLREFSCRVPLRSLFYATLLARRGIEGSIGPADAVEPIREAYTLPADWSRERVVEFNIAQYKKYLALSDALAERLQLKSAHFIQPVPAIGKRLTADEIRVAGNLSYAPTYQRMTDAMVDAGAVSLLDCFEGVDATLYRDLVHCNPEGYRILAERVAGECARLWNGR